MPEVLFPLDSDRKFRDQEKVGHNRWHPDIPPVATVRPGQSFRVYCREWFDGEVHNDDSADDVRDYLVWLRGEKRAAPGTLKIAINGLRFYYRHTCPRDWQGR